MAIEIEWLETLIKNKERERCVKKALNLTSASATGKHENFLSDIQRVTVDVVLSNGTRTSRSLIVKTLPKSKGEHVKYVVERGMFAKEIKMYEWTLKCMSRKIETSGDPQEKLWCEMIGYDPYGKIVFEDLCESGFQTIDAKTTTFDRQTTLLVVESFARFHALSVAAKNDGVYEPVEYKNYEFSSEGFTTKGLAYLLRTAAESIDRFWGPKWRDIASRIKTLSENMDRFRRLKRENNKLSVLNHGDAWSGNIMIKRDKNNNPVAVKIIDFQIFHYDSFAWDLSHVLYCSVEPNIRRDHFNEFLEAYLNSLNEHLELYGAQISNPLTMEDVQQEMDRLRLFPLILQFLNVALVTCQLDNVIDMEEWCASEGKEVGGINPEIFACEKFRKRVEIDLEMFAADGTI